MLLPYFNADMIEAGCDEAGRGCLAGPVVAAAVILPVGFQDPVLNDSKLLTREEREGLQGKILDAAIDYGIGVVDNEEIDRINILKASIKAMHLALDQLKKKPEFILVDGNMFTAYRDLQHQCIVRGDGKYMSIAAASILAKTYRDSLMRQFALDFPDYRWDTNVGYATMEHRKAIKKSGLTPYHRRSFRQLPDQLDLFDPSE